MYNGVRVDVSDSRVCGNDGVFAGMTGVSNGVGMDIQIPAFAGMTECLRE